MAALFWFLAPIMSRGWIFAFIAMSGSLWILMVSPSCEEPLRHQKLNAVPAGVLPEMLADTDRYTISRIC